MHENIASIIRDSRVALTTSQMKNNSFPLTAANPAFCFLTGYTEADIVGQDCKFLQGPLTETSVAKEIGKMLRDEEQREANFFITNYRKNGDRFENFLSIYKFEDVESGSDFILASQFDLTAAKSMSDFDGYARDLSSGISNLNSASVQSGKMIIEGAKLVSKTTRSVIAAKLALN